jgi:hypothetical protein
MAPSALLDLATRAGCPPAQDRHRLDCLVRWLLANGWDGPQITVVAGIGTLTIGPSGQDWKPATQATPPPAPLPAPEPLRLARAAACAACDRFHADHCTVAGCGCAGLGKPERLLSKCPLGRWPTSTE